MFQTIFTHHAKRVLLCNDFGSILKEYRCYLFYFLERMVTFRNLRVLGLVWPNLISASSSKQILNDLVVPVLRECRF